MYSQAEPVNEEGTVAQTYSNVAAPFMGLVRAEPAVARQISVLYHNGIWETARGNVGATFAVAQWRAGASLIPTKAELKVGITYH